MKIKDITVVLLLYNTPPNVIKNLKIYKDFKILILDQSNDFILKKKLLKILPNIQFYKGTKDNLGFAQGVNFLIKKVKTKYFLCTQPDVIVSKKDILKLKKPFLLKKDCIISIPSITSKSINFKNNIQSVNSFIGAIFLSETNKFIKFGGFDADFFFYWEDVDFSQRVKLSRYNIYLSSLSKAKHLFGKSTEINFKIFFLKYSNFKFGEYLFQYKFNKLKIVKQFREPFLIIIKIFISLITFNKTNLYKYFSFISGIIRFYLYLLKK